MTEKNRSDLKIFTGTEKASLLVVAILAAVNFLIGQREIAIGIVAGGVLFTADFIAIRLIVDSLTRKQYTVSFNIFLFVIKLLILLLIVGSLLLFANLNIYGFFIALTAVILVIAGSGLKENKNGTF